MDMNVKSYKYTSYIKTKKKNREYLNQMFFFFLNQIMFID